MPPRGMRNDAGPIPILAATLGIFLLTLMDGMIKSVSEGYPTSVIVLMRFTFGGLVAGALYLALGRPRITRSALQFAAIRGVFVVLSAGLFFAGLRLLPLVEAIALSFISPIILAVFGRVFLGEAIGANALAGIVLGSIGVAIMLADQLVADTQAQHNLLGIAAVLASAFTYAASLILLRRQAGRDPLPVLVLLQNWIPALYILPMAASQWVTPAPASLVTFLGIGVLGALGHVALTWAFARANAARLGVVEYTALVWGALIGFIWFAEVPAFSTLAGAVLIIAGAVAVSWTPRTAQPVA